MKISREQAEDETMKVFQELGSKDQHFTYRVQADKEGRINSLKWANVNNKLQYTFGTTYRINLNDMPFGLFVGVKNHFQSRRACL